MPIQIVKNANANAVELRGLNEGIYYNACLSGRVSEVDGDRVDIVNDVKSAAAGEAVFEVHARHYTEFLDADGNGFADATAAADYITTECNTIVGSGVRDVGASQEMRFTLDQTHTTILLSDGKAFPVNSLKAVPGADGHIEIWEHGENGSQLYGEIYLANCYASGALVPQNLNGAINTLNALFTVSPVGAGGGWTPVYPTLDGVEITPVQAGGVDPIGDNIFGSTSTSQHGARYRSTETINEPGEYFTFRQANHGQFIFGLGSVSNGDLADFDSSSGNGHSGFFYAQAMYDYGSYMAPWTTYGSNSSLSYGPGWSFSGNDPMFRYSTAQQNMADGNDALFKVGITDGGYVGAWYFDIDETNDWILLSRSSTPLVEGEYFFGLKIASTSSQLVEIPLRYATDPAAPVLDYRYIESPDGAHTYPLFASADEAEYVDSQFTGTAGEVTAHVFVDEPTASVWYKPVHVGNEGVQFPPSDTAEITYTEIPTLADNLFAPAALNIQNYSVAENSTVNIQIIPQDVPATVTGLPTGLTYGAGYITGTTEYVIRDTDYTVTVERSNSYGTTTETFAITVADNASLSDISGFTQTQGNFVQPSRIILTHDALLQYDAQINPGEELTYSYGYGQIPPTIGILNATGVANLAAFDPATDTLGEVSNVNDFAQTNQWDLRYVSFGDHIGGAGENHTLTGWADNTTQTGAEGNLFDQQFKLEYGLDGYFRLYVGGVLKLTSANTFSGAQTLTLAGFDDQNQTDAYIPSNLAIATTGAGSTTPPTGFVDPVESGEMANTTTFGNGTDSGVVFLTETLKVNHRYIVPRAWIEANVLPNIAGAGANAQNDEQFLFGVPKAGVNWATVDVNHFHVCFRIEGTSSGNLSRLFYNNTSTNTVSIASATNAYYDYAIEWDGTSLHVIACNIGDINTATLDDVNNGFFSRVGTFSNFAASTGSTNTELNLVIAVRNGAQVDLATSGLQQIRIPFGVRDVLVGEASGGGSMFALAPSATIYDSHSSGHASTTLGMSFDPPTLNAGYTYRFLYHPSMEAGDDIKFTRIDDGTDYTTGVTFFDGTSAGDPNFTDGYKGVTFAVPSDAPPLNVGYNNDHQGNTNYVLKPLPLSGSTYVLPVTGITLEGPAANQTGNNMFDAPVGGSVEWGWLSIDEQLGAGERLILSNAFLVDLTNAMPNDSMVQIGLKDGTFSTNNRSNSYSNFEGGARFEIFRYSASDIRVFGRVGSSGIGRNYGTNGIANSGVALAIDLTNSGNNIRLLMESGLNISDDVTSTAYADWDSSYKIQTGDQGFGLTNVDVVMLGDGQTVGNSDQADGAFNTTDVDWTALSEVAVPTPATGLTTNWTKALDFSGSAERTLQVENNSNRCPIMMGGISTTVLGSAVAGKTTASGSGRPWATAIVFSPDNHNSNQHIWNLGEGTGSTDDNIYLRLSASGQIYFGWGRDGALNECYLGNVASGSWYGLYLASTGERLSGANATANSLANCFDIRWVTLSSGQVQLNRSTASNWTSTGGRMDRQFLGDMTIGGRGSNRSFHGKVASMVVTTLSLNVDMPGDAEISMMVCDPEQWLTDYKVGNYFRLPWQGTNAGFNFSINDGSSSYSTQVWLMGDGTGDGYAQIRNQVNAADQNYTALNMISMVSNDIENVTISGLS